MDQRSLGNDTKAPLEALPYPWQIPVISIYSVTAFISLGSNLITIIILLRGEHLSTVLWKFLLNLSAADILMAVFCIPFTYTNYMYGQWILFHPLCPIVQFVQVTSVTVSIYSLAVIGLDRYFAIIYPFRPVHCLKQNKFALIILIWALGCCVGSPSLFFVEVYPFTYQNATYYACDETFTEAESRLYTVFIFLLTFLIPIVGITFVYSRICIHLISNSAAPGNPDQNRDRVIVDKKIKVIKMLVTIVVMFFICWFPIHMFQLLVHFYPGFNDQKTSHGYYLYVGSYFAVHWLSMAHCLVNPFVYCFMSDNFRHSIRCTLAKCFSHFRRFDGEDCRDLTMTQVQSVTLMPTNSLQSTPKGEVNSRIIRDNSTSKNGANNQNPSSKPQIDDDEFV